MPEPTRMQLPEGYGAFEPFTIETAPSWDDYEPMLEQSRNYWIAISGAPTPVVVPVWGIWIDGTLVFSTDPKSRKAKSLSKNPGCVVHLESGDDVMIVHGTAERVPGTDATAFLNAYELKYGIVIDPESDDQAIFRVIPSFALTWLERDFIETATRWDF